MAVDIATFKRPGGLLEPDWFPKGDLDDRLTAFRDAAQGPDGTGGLQLSDSLTRAYVFAYAFNSLIDDLNAQPIDQRTADRSDRYALEQVEWFREQREFWFGVYWHRYGVEQAAEGDPEPGRLYAGTTR